MLEKLQIEIDSIKSQLSGISTYATLSGLNALSRHYIVEPYLFSMETGINHAVNEAGYIEEFKYEFKGLVHKHYIDEKSLKDPKGSSFSNFSVIEPITGKTNISDYSSEQLWRSAENAKINEEIEEKMIKQAEKDFLEAILILFKEGGTL